MSWLNGISYPLNLNFNGVAGSTPADTNVYPVFVFSFLIRDLRAGCNHLPLDPMLVEGFSSGSEEMSEVLAAVPVAHAVYSFLLCSSMVPWASGNASELSRRFEPCRHHSL